MRQTHSFAPHFDSTGNSTSLGTVTQYGSEEPASYLHLNAVDGERQTREYVCECTAVTQLTRIGITPQVGTLEHVRRQPGGVIPMRVSLRNAVRSQLFPVLPSRHSVEMNSCAGSSLRYCVSVPEMSSFLVESNAARSYGCAVACGVASMTRTMHTVDPQSAILEACPPLRAYITALSARSSSRAQAYGKASLSGLDGS